MSPAPLTTITSSAPSPLRSATRGVAWGLVAIGPGAVNVPLRLSNTDTLLERLLATARSVRPSPLKSAATRDFGPSYPAAYRTWFWKVPSPLPSNTDTSLEPSLATARSVRPSPLKSPVTRAYGPYPAAYRTWFWKVPSPLPSSTDTSLSLKLATARSVRPSPVKSPATRAFGPYPVAY